MSIDLTKTDLTIAEYQMMKPNGNSYFRYRVLDGGRVIRLVEFRDGITVPNSITESEKTNNIAAVLALVLGYRTVVQGETND